ncbi:MAG: pyruvate dehydrogenase (acetyl-transferring), homodimeric type, partial [Desulfofustis sp.]|nr:pyruvate dehydrogenase (acetyl-transferring), homodimeric type [Desulfofustis sp.]
YAPTGQLYEPQDSETIAWYREDPKGQILEEGITEAGSISSWLAAGTAHVNYGIPMIPFYIFYSIFGFQRIGDQLWAAGDSKAKGFLLGATSGRTTLNGEGLQHQDGHSLLFASAYPSCRAYDPTFAYEVAVLVQNGLELMYGQGEDVFYYITLLNENYTQPAMPEGVEEGIHRGMYLFSGPDSGEAEIQLMGSGSILREVVAASELLKDEYNIDANVWSVLGINQLHRDGMMVSEWNRLHPDQPKKESYVQTLLKGARGPAVISTDNVCAYAEQIRNQIGLPLTILGTDGYGRSDTREVLRRFFGVDRYHIVVSALKALADEEKISLNSVAEAINKFGIDPDSPHPLTC